jgi:hypothetical protein
VKLTPVAFSIAFSIAGAAPSIGSSPIPFAPSGSSKNLDQPKILFVQSLFELLSNRFRGPIRAWPVSICENLWHSMN